MEITIPVNMKFDVKVRDTQGKHAYIVAMCCGGVMEDPEIHYEDYQLIRADSEDEARRAYDFLNDCTYYYGSVICQVE
jgi:hypothetical protein